MKQKKVPMRKCIGCMAVKEKKALVRIVKMSDNGEITVDFTGRKNGRGAYVCRDLCCMEKVIKNNGLSREFEKNISKDEYSRLMEEFSKGLTLPEV